MPGSRCGPLPVGWTSAVPSGSYAANLAIAGSRRIGAPSPSSDAKTYRRRWQPIGQTAAKRQYLYSGFLARDGTGSRIHVVDQAAYGAGHRLIDVMVLHNIFGREALNPLSG
jgi:hypothetical protein